MKQLLKGIDEMRIQLGKAAEMDLGREPFTTDFIDVKPCEFDLKHNISHIDEVN